MNATEFQFLPHRLFVAAIRRSKSCDMSGTETSVHDRELKIYDSTDAPVAEAILRLAGSHGDVAEALGVDVSAIEDWIRDYPEFRAACDRGRAEANSGPQRSLFRRAVGYDHEVEKVMKKGSRAYVVSTREHIKPELSACRLWLMNRRPEKWKKLGKGSDEKTVDEFLGELLRAMKEKDRQERERREPRN
jgi:hypothetical protein